MTYALNQFPSGNNSTSLECDSIFNALPVCTMIINAVQPKLNTRNLHNTLCINEIGAYSLKNELTHKHCTLSNYALFQ